MSSRRALKAAQAIREVVSTAILMQLKDPRVKDVTVTLVEVSGDLRNAKVYVSVMGDPTKQDLCLKGLQSSTGFLQKKVGNRIETRYIPRLTFVLDKGAKNAMEVTRILNEVLPAEQQKREQQEGEQQEVGQHELEQQEGAAKAQSDQAPSTRPADSVEPDSVEPKSVEPKTRADSENPWPAIPPGLKTESTESHPDT